MGATPVLDLTVDDGTAAEPTSPSVIPGQRKKRRHRSGPPVGREFRRFAARGLEVRSAGDGSDQIEITGTPIVYGQSYTVVDMLGEFEETMHPGVATNVLAAGADVRFLFNHDGLPLARTTSATLTLTDSLDGLGMRAALDARQQLANDLAVAIERGDVNQMSCGFVVANDDWNSDYTQRDIYRFEELFDVSAVTYPASPTTSVELALRSMMSAPVESRARVRKLWQVTHEMRAGKVLSAANATLLQDALEALHQADDVDIPAMVNGLQTVDEALDKGQAGLAAVLGNANPDDDDDTGEATSAEDGTANNPPGGTAAGVTDGTGSRARFPAPHTCGERRDASMSFGDIRDALTQALIRQYAAADCDWCDLWVEDFGVDWVVFNSWEPNPGAGLWQMAYSLDGNGAVILASDPEQVTTKTSYVPVADPADAATTAAPSVGRSVDLLTLEAEQMRLRGRRHRLIA
ncbi:MAG TPA: HK97 family phage prohead protease [Pseudonocardiaceae bacterium]|nr:HK97 family phage prohead protease [Pseudonocardiaceae bacterium]